MDEDCKKYNIYENILQKINKNYVALPSDEKKRNNQILQVVDRIIQTLRDKNILFNSLYQNKFYGGSFYDGLRVGTPSEYDLDCLLILPKTAEPKIVVSDIPGYVHVTLKNRKALEKKVDEAPKYVGLDKLLDGENLSTKNVRSWMESLFSSVVGENAKTEITVDDKKCIVKYRMVKSGPALTLKLEGVHDEKNFNLDVDLVPGFIFTTDEWPKKGYRPNPSRSRNNFFVVPKSPTDDQHLYWRLSFQEQERELLNGCSVMKPALRLIKRVRDRHQHKIASYFIKTIFLWELDKSNKDLHTKSLSFVFVMMLKKYSEYLEKKNIPYYWNAAYNLIGHLPNEIVVPIAERIKNIVLDIDRKCNSRSDIYGIVYYLLSQNEVDIETFKLEVPLSKKLQKQLESSKYEDTKPLIVFEESSFSSEFSSFEDITKDSILEPSIVNGSKESPDVHSLLLTIVSEQKRNSEMLEKVFQKLEDFQNEIRDLRAKIDNDRLENAICNQETLRLISCVEKKLDNVKKGELQISADALLGINNQMAFLPS